MKLSPVEFCICQIRNRLDGMKDSQLKRLNGNVCSFFFFFLAQLGISKLNNQNSFSKTQMIWGAKHVTSQRRAQCLITTFVTGNLYCNILELFWYLYTNKRHLCTGCTHNCSKHTKLTSQALLWTKLEKYCEGNCRCL